LLFNVAITSCQFIFTAEIEEGRMNNLIGDSSTYEKKKERKHENTEKRWTKEKSKHLLFIYLQYSIPLGSLQTR